MTIRLTAEQRAAFTTEASRRYLNGDSIRTIAKALGAGYGTVHTHLVQAGIQLRPHAYHHSQLTTAEQHIRRVSMRNRYQDGESVHDLALAFALSDHTVRRHLIAAGTRMRPVGHHKPRKAGA